MGVDREYRIKISTQADNSGAKETADTLGKVTGETGKLSKATDEAGQSIKKTTEHAHEGAKGFDKFELSGREARMMIDRLGPGVEGLGHLLTDLTNPLAAVGFGLVVAKGLFDEFNKSLDETAKKNAEATFSEAINAVREAMEKGGTAAEEYAEKMALGIDPQEQYAKALENTLTALRNTAAEQGQIADAAFGLDADKLKLQLDQGVIAQEQYFIKLGELEKKHEAEKLARQVAAEDAELDAMRKGVEHTNQQAPILDAAAKSARSGATAASAKAANDEAMLKVLEGRKEVNAKAALEAEELINKNGGLGAVEQRANYKGIDPFATQEAPKYAAMLSAFRAAVGTQNYELTKADAIRGRLPDEKSGAATAERAASRAESASEKNQDRLADAIEKFNAKAEEYDRKDLADAVIAGINAQRTDIKTAGQLGGLGLDPGQAQRAGAGGQVVSDMTRGMASLQDQHSAIAAAAVQAVTASTQVSTALQDLSRNILSGQAATAEQIRQLNRALEQLRSQTSWQYGMGTGGG